MNVLVLGSGAREHALATAIRKSPTADKVFVHPGNAGIFRDGFSALKQNEVSSAKNENIELCVIGPETLLDEGVADKYRAAGIGVVGVGKKAARLESSKLFAKKFMEECKIPTASFRVAKTKEELVALARTQTQFPCVLKFDGLAAGKGVVIAQAQDDIIQFSRRVYDERVFGTTSNTVLLEEFTRGREISYIGLCDGKSFVPLSSATDYKRVFDGEEGSNTGGMGAISPSPFLTRELEEKITKSVIQPFLKGLEHNNLDYRGALFVGLMIDAKGEPNVLEFNVRFGDPETQSILMRLKSDFLKTLLATAEGKLAMISQLEWAPHHCVYVVAAAEGYPEKPVTGDVISGLEDCPDNAYLFCAGLEKRGPYFVTAGGRVLGVGCLGLSRDEARRLAYKALEKIRWRGQHYRTDIGNLYGTH